MGSPAQVVGSSDVDWTQVTVNNWIVISGNVYLITSVDAVNKLLTISPSFAGGAYSGSYVIVRDFTKNYGMPLLNPGDLEASALWSRALQIIDAVMGTGVAPAQDVLSVTQTAHGMYVGNAVYYNGSAWVRCAATLSGTPESGTNPQASCVMGIVSAVPDANTFQIKNSGKITGVQGLSSVSGKIVYLKETNSHPNLVTAVTSGSAAPIMLMTSDTEGYLLTIRNPIGKFRGSNSQGLVPNPGAATGSNFLCDDGTFKSSGSAAADLSTTHMLKTGSVDWTSFISGVGGLSLIKHISDLQSRLDAVEGSGGSQASGGYVRNVFTRRSGFYYVSTPGGVPSALPLAGSDPGAGSDWSSGLFALPANIKKIRVTLISSRAQQLGVPPSNAAFLPDQPVDLKKVVTYLVNPNALQMWFEFAAGGQQISFTLGKMAAGGGGVPNTTQAGYAAFYSGSNQMALVRKPYGQSDANYVARYDLPATAGQGYRRSRFEENSSAYLGSLMSSPSDIPSNPSDYWYGNGILSPIVILEFGGPIEYEF